MIKTTLAISTTLALLAFAAVPASAAPASCSGPDLTKAETTIETMPYSDARWAGYREIMLAQNDLLAGNLRGCAMHVGRVMHMKAMQPSM